MQKKKTSFMPVVMNIRPTVVVLKIFSDDQLLGRAGMLAQAGLLLILLILRILQLIEILSSVHPEIG
jgi:hypothetical protein